MALKVKTSSRYTFVIQMLDCSEGIFVMHASFILGSPREERSLLSVFSSEPLFTGRGVSPEGKLLWKKTHVLEAHRMSDGVDSTLQTVAKQQCNDLYILLNVCLKLKEYSILLETGIKPLWWWTFKTACLILQENLFYASCYRYPYQEPSESSLCWMYAFAFTKIDILCASLFS